MRAAVLLPASCYCLSWDSVHDIPYSARVPAALKAPPRPGACSKAQLTEVMVRRLIALLVLMCAAASAAARPANDRTLPVVLRAATLQPGEYGTTTVSLRPGSYVMYSSVGRHEALGEYGTLTVTRR